MDLVAKLLLQRFDELCGFFGRDLIRAVIENPLVFIAIRFFGKSDGIDAEGCFVRLHIDAHADRFKRRASLGIHLWVIPHHGKICRIAFGNHILGHIVDKTDDSVARHIVHTRLFRDLKRCFAAERLDFVIRHTVADHNDIFHKTKRPFCC